MIEADQATLMGRCLLALWSNHSRLGDAIVLVSVGTLDEAELLPPDVHCFTVTRHPWIVLPDGVPAYEGDYDAAKVWSVEGTARLNAVISASCS